MGRNDILVPPDNRIALDGLSLLSNKWGPVVVVVLLESGPLRFSELERAIPDISSNMLTETLTSLSEHGLVHRSVVSESPLTVTYELTDAGRALEPVFDSLATWGNEYIDSVQATVVLGDGDRRLVELYGGWLRDRFTVVTAPGRASLQDVLVEAPDVVVFDIDLWGDDPSVFAEYCPDLTRRVALVGDRPDLSLCAWPCDDVLRKPLVEADLMNAVSSQVEQLGQSETERERDSIEAKLSMLESVYPKSRLMSHPATANLYRRRD